jgi:tripartite-type tricarboxylate transporter receptor subunit TctC
VFRCSCASLRLHRSRNGRSGRIRRRCQVQVIFDPIIGAIEYIRAGKLRPLTVTSATRSELLPDIPTVREFVPGYEAIGWQGIGAPKDTTPEIVDRLNREINGALADRKFNARIADLGGEPMPMVPAAFGIFIVEYTEKWGNCIEVCRVVTDDC